MPAPPTRKAGGAAALLASGVLAGGVLAATMTASAATSTPTPTSTSTASPGHLQGTALTGDALAKVKAAVAAKYPGSTLHDAETDDTSAYEAHITQADGTHVAVELDKAFAVTGVETHAGPGGHGGHGGRHGFDGTALTGDALAKVKAAVAAKYPGSTLQDAETDDTSAYEAHITKADGTPVSVELDKAFAVTGEETHGGQGAPSGTASGTASQAG